MIKAARRLVCLVFGCRTNVLLYGGAAPSVQRLCLRCGHQARRIYFRRGLWSHLPPDAKS